MGFISNTWKIMYELSDCNAIVFSYCFRCAVFGYVFGKIFNKDLSLISPKFTSENISYFFALIGIYYGFKKGFIKMIKNRIQ
ncbi:hypothetical protein CE11_00662 [Megavirus courdo11]|uniref:Uncharacterized protein n=3 Tax=Megavirus TaxID=3044761 RepID=L7Y4S8_9VIRU|nr:hypothetical protein c7_R731 [Megavirus courdo7]AFX92688.1 hypothetical protein CE11_00662 [Megavirus courdo11]AGD92546.1 hypothetical protein LBA_00628 [Megavirus lba]